MEGYLHAGDHVVLHRRNRALVDGRTSHLRSDPDEWIWFVAFIVLSLLAVVAWAPSNPLAALLLMVVPVLLTAMTVQTFRERARFEHDGRLLTGEVTAVDECSVRVENPGYILGAPTSWDSRRLAISYRFLTPTGEERTDVVLSSPPRRWRATPSPGDQLAILYVEPSRQELSRLTPPSDDAWGDLRAVIGARRDLDLSGTVPAEYALSYFAYYEVM